MAEERGAFKEGGGGGGVGSERRDSSCFESNTAPLIHPEVAKQRKHKPTE